MLKATLVAGVGGFIGTCLRFLSEQLGAVIPWLAFPVGTFIANIIGCLLIGIFYGWSHNRAWFGKKLNILLITGLCGGLTTFSSMSDELLGLLEKGNVEMFALYLIASLSLGLLAVAVGIALIKPNNKSVAQS